MLLIGVLLFGTIGQATYAFAPAAFGLLRLVEGWRTAVSLRSVAAAVVQMLRSRVSWQGACDDASEIV